VVQQHAGDPVEEAASADGRVALRRGLARDGGSGSGSGDCLRSGSCTQLLPTARTARSVGKRPAERGALDGNATAARSGGRTARWRASGRRGPARGVDGVGLLGQWEGRPGGGALARL
jgi:hypothetical protein